MKIHSRMVLPVVLGLMACAQNAFAQADKYKAGDKIEYREPRYSDNWESGGTYVGATPGDKQPIIRKRPNEFYPEGSQTAYEWEAIRPMSAKPAAKVPADSPAKPPGKAPEPARKVEPEMARAPVVADGPLLTQAEILNFLKTRLGDQPFAHPKRDEIKKELAEMIKRRGVNFRYETLSDFSNELGKYGASSEIRFPLGDNYGPPTKLAWLVGKWNLNKIGATVDYKGNDGYIYRQGEIGVKDVGVITISPDGTYTWDIDVPKGVARGQWRKATPDEMPYQGGDAIVLLKAKGGVDWIVHQDRVTTLPQDWVNVAQLAARGIREGGYRVKAK